MINVKKNQLLSEYKNGHLLYSEKNTATEMNFFSLNLNNVRRTQIKISSKKISAFFFTTLACTTERAECGACRGRHAISTSYKRSAAAPDCDIFICIFFRKGKNQKNGQKGIINTDRLLILMAQKQKACQRHFTPNEVGVKLICFS